VLELIERTLVDPATRAQGIALAAATGDGRYRASFESVAEDAKLPEDVRVAAVEALGSTKVTPNRVLDQLIAAVRGQPSSNPLAEAAVRATAKLYDSRDHLVELLTTRAYPLGVRRESLRLLGQFSDGAPRVLDLARAGKLPEDLKSEATTLVHTARDRRVREQARSVLPLPTTSAGRPLPSIFELIRRDGDADKGRQVFFRTSTNSCSGCHRVQGQGQWIGPDLSTVGVKYGRDELIRSILSPSAAIGYSFRSLVVALTDGRVLTGLPIQETDDRLILKTALGERIPVARGLIEDRRTSDVSLMPEGLAQTMTDQELVDLLAYLTTLKQPVSIVGQYHVIGPVYEPAGRSIFAPISRLDPHAPASDGRGHTLSWRRLTADAEGMADLAPLIAGDFKNAAYAWVPLVSPIAQKARLVIDTQAEISAWLDAKPVLLPRAPAGNEPCTAEVDLPEGKSALVIRVTPNGKGVPKSALVTTLVAERPISFSDGEAGGPAR
jgi:putative heme-binding domain-containing protein